MKKGDMVECTGTIKPYHGMVGHVWMIDEIVGNELWFMITNEHHKPLVVKMPRQEFRLVG